MARFLYSCLFYVMMPFIVLRLLWRSIKAPAYRSRFFERLGFFPNTRDSRQTIWLHTVSVGETIATGPLVQALLAAYPNYQLLITTTTPTGSAQLQKMYADELAQGHIIHSYIPYDLPGAIKRFLKKTKPRLAIFMETEVWPNTLHTNKALGVDSVLVNARLSEKSFRGYQRFRSLARPSFACFSHIAAQAEDDAKRIGELASGVSLSVTGNIKSEIRVSESMRAQAQQLKQQWSLDGEKTIIIAASTHGGEDEIILGAYRELSQQHMDLLLVLVPRHPERFASVRQLCESRGFTTVARSQNIDPSRDTQVLLGDTMGEMMLFYGCSDIAIVCGSFIPHGGHNMLEPAAWGLPIISGDSLYNFATISREMQTQDALLIAKDQAELVNQLQIMLNDKEYGERLGANAIAYVGQHGGALDKSIAILDPYLSR